MSVLPSWDGPPGTHSRRFPSCLEVVVVSTPPPPGSSEPRDEPRDDDPTGVRRLLASLPDPGPIPPDLAQRISASLAAEQAARQSRQTVVPLRPRRWRTVGLVAAAVAVLGVGVPALVTGNGPGEITALFTNTTASDSSAAGSAGDQQAEAGSGMGGATALKANVGIYLTGTAYTSASFAAQARAFQDSPGTVLRTLAAEAPSIGPVGTQAGLRECLDAMGVDPSTTVIADIATFDGKPAVVLVLTTAGGQHAVAVSRTCSAGRVERLADTPLP